MTRQHRLAMKWIVFVLLLSGCIGSDSQDELPIGVPETGQETEAETTETLVEWHPGGWKPMDCEVQASPFVIPTELVFRQGKYLSFATWNGTQFEQGPLDDTPSKFQVPFQGQVATLRNDTLQILNHQFEGPRIEVTDLTALFATDKLYLIDNWTMRVFDEGLNELYQVPTPPPHVWWEKEIDYAYVEGDTAYLLDNVVYPFYAFKVNLTTREVTTIEVSGGGLDGQWVGEEWWIRSNFFGMSGGAYGVSRVNGSELDVGYSLWSTYYEGEEAVQTQGYRVGHGHVTLPAWTPLHANGTQYLALVDLQDGPVMSCMHELEIGYIAHRHRVGVGHDELMVFDGAGVVRFTQSFGENISQVEVIQA